MRILIQRVLNCHVSVDEQIVSRIDRGLLVLVGVGEGDSIESAKYLADRTQGLRIFADSEGKMNLNISQVGGSILVVSQFTLYADVHRGRRPGFTKAASPDLGRELYETYCEELRKYDIPIATGVFQADMQVALVNDGPVTIWIDSRDKDR